MTSDPSGLNTARTPSQLTEIIREHATFMRGVLLRALKDSIASEDTTNTCAYACVLLSVSLGKFFGLEVQFQGGGGGLDGGFVDLAGVARGHYWLKATAPSGEAWVVDITADQFGGDPVVVLPFSESEERYVPGDQSTVDRGIGELMAEIMAPAKL